MPRSMPTSLGSPHPRVSARPARSRGTITSGCLHCSRAERGAKRGPGVPGHRCGARRDAVLVRRRAALGRHRERRAARLRAGWRRRRVRGPRAAVPLRRRGDPARRSRLCRGARRPRAPGRRRRESARGARPRGAPTGGDAPERGQGRPAGALLRRRHGRRGGRCRVVPDRPRPSRGAPRRLRHHERARVVPRRGARLRRRHRGEDDLPRPVGCGRRAGRAHRLPLGRLVRWRHPRHGRLPVDRGARRGRGAPARPRRRGARAHPAARPERDRHLLRRGRPVDPVRLLRDGGHVGRGAPRGAALRRRPRHRDGGHRWSGPAVRGMSALPSPAQGQRPIWAEPQRPRHVGTAVAAVFGIALGALACAAVLVYLVSGLGVAGVGIAALAALVPFVLVLAVVRWIDRWEPEPRAALVFAVLWGAGVAVAIALLFDLGVQIAVGAAGARPNDLLQAVVQAPIVEEGAKGFGVLLLFWFNRRNFDGPVDGLVYAATVAAGFAFTENILYFGRALAESGLGGQFAVIFVARGLFSPFAHALFTSCTGYALGRAAERTGAFGAVGYFLVGLIPAAFLHALWNGGLALARNEIGYYFSVEVPIFLLAVGLVLGVRARERGITRARLTEYAEVGWFSADEVALLSTWTGRRQALRWADQQPDRRRKRAAMIRFLRGSTPPGHARQRLLRQRTGVGRTPDEQELLRRISADRAALVS